MDDITTPHLADLEQGVHTDMPEHLGFKYYALCTPAQTWFEWLAGKKPDLSFERCWGP